MNGPINIPFRTRGRAPLKIQAALVRELEPADLELLAQEKGSKVPPLKRLTDRHHALARCLASGMREQDAAIACGYAPSRVSILKNDPAFKELLEFYRDSTEKIYRDMHERLSGLAADAVDELHARIEEDMQQEEKKVSIGQLIEITKLGADRTGHGPQSTHNHNVNVGLASRLENARKRLSARKASDVVIDVDE